MTSLSLRGPFVARVLEAKNDIERNAVERVHLFPFFLEKRKRIKRKRDRAGENHQAMSKQDSVILFIIDEFLCSVYTRN
jgi:hypothetical protein